MFGSDDGRIEHGSGGGEDGFSARRRRQSLIKGEKGLHESEDEIGK